MGGEDEQGVEDAGDADERSGRRSRSWLLPVGAVVVAGAIGVAILGSRDGGPSRPDEWAAEVQPYVEFVERERGLDFLHPVEVEFLPEDDFREEVTADDADLTEEEREELEDVTGLFRAFGLVEGDLDLFASVNELTGEGVVGFYSFEDRHIVMRGTDLTPAVELTLVHELVHALQDQHFDIGDRALELGEREDATGSAVLTGLVEGDASRVETAYRFSLSAAEQDALAEEEAAQLAAFEDGVEDVPLVLQTLFAVPYVFGEAFVDVAIALDGNDGVDELFRELPTSEEPLFDPWQLAVDDEPVDVDPPELDDDETEFDRGVVGSPTWLLVLAERIDLDVALSATDGWGGDAYVAFRRDGVVCLRAEWRGDTAADLDEMAAALDAWLAAGPPDSGAVERHDDGLRFESCDPGADAAGSAREASDQAIAAAVTRSYAALGFYESGATVEQARCVGADIIEIFEPEELTDPTFEPDADDQQRIFDAVTGCT